MPLYDSRGGLFNPPACRVYHNANQALASATDVVLAFNQERYDTDSMHDTVTNNSRITFNTAGLYLVVLNLAIDDLNDYNFFAGRIGLNVGGTILAGQVVSGNSTSWLYQPWFTVTTVYKFAVGDYIQAVVQQRNNAAATKNLLTAGNWSPEFSATWLGVG